ncbi:hypothetical protein BRD00_12440 [Halobacteriales archaeon QS_8_69_26]|nr:MAG: hypothetical protein BRD00_12440 [Halobacteriales archaeon QS_8_69_26]
MRSGPESAGGSGDETERGGSGDGWPVGTVLVLLLYVALAGAGSWLALGGYDALTGHGDWDHTPSAVFEYEYDPWRNELTVVHAGGDHYLAENTDRLVVVVTRPDGRTENHTIGPPFTTCDTYTLRAPPGSTAEVRWRGPSEDRWLVPGEFEVPSTAVTATNDDCSRG